MQMQEKAQMVSGQAQVQQLILGQVQVQQPMTGQVQVQQPMTGQVQVQQPMMGQGQVQMQRPMMGQGQMQVQPNMVPMAQPVQYAGNGNGQAVEEVEVHGVKLRGYGAAADGRQLSMLFKFTAALVIIGMIGPIINIIMAGFELKILLPRLFQKLGQFSVLVEAHGQC